MMPHTEQLALACHHAAGSLPACIFEPWVSSGVLAAPIW